MSGNGNGNGNEEDQKPLSLKVITSNVEGKQETETDSTVVDPNYLHAWQKTVGSVTLEQIHEGLIAVQQLAEVAVELSIKVSKEVLALSSRVNDLESRVSSLQQPVNEVRKNLQGLRDDLREIDEKTRLIPAIKATLLDIYGRLPD